MTDDARPEQTEDRRFVARVARVSARVPFAPELVAGYYAMRDPRTPWRHKAILAGAIAYFVLPIDAIPDFILPIGYADDAAAIMAAVGAVRLSIREEHRTRALRVLGRVHEGSVVDGSVVDGSVGDAPGEAREADARPGMPGGPA